MGIFGSANSWRGLDGEEEMTDEDWIQRAGDQARAMLNGLPSDLSSPDEDGVATGGCYNGDYSQAVQDKLNQQLDEDEYYEAEVEGQIRELYHYREDS